MRNIVKILLLICLIVNSNNTISQTGASFIPSDFNNYFFTPKNIGLTTPQVQDFVKYGNLNIDYYNGLLNMEIPLGGYKDNDFDIPVSIKYVSSGFVPSKRPSTIGYNWFLNFGGVISRKVNGSPDETKGSYTRNLKDYLKDGYLVPIKEKTFKQYSEDELLKFNVGKNKGAKGNPYGNGDLKFDMEPDIFNFSFGKHRGSFIIDNTGKVTLLSGDNQYRVDIEGLSIQSYSTTEKPINSSIIITTADGYIYEFGGDTSYLEYFIPNNPDGLLTRPRYINSWFLKSIKSPNSRSVKFKYRSVSQPYRYTSFYYSAQMMEIFGNCGKPDSPPTFSSSAAVKAEQVDLVDDIYTPMITSVEVDSDEKIRFEYKDQNYFNDDDLSKSQSLSSIQYYYYKNKIKQVSFNYKQQDRYFFIESLINVDGGKYYFKYNLDKTLPSPLTTSLDHWGFWSGGNITKQENVKVYMSNIEKNRDVNTDYSDVALLKKVIYPTKGYTEIEYEPNYYNIYHSQDSSRIHVNAFQTQLDTPAGGARVRSIKDFDPNTKDFAHSRRFRYKNIITNRGSGVIGLLPRYINKEMMVRYPIAIGCSERQTSTFVDISANSFGLNNLYEEYHIGYPYVVEEFDDGSYNYYSYTSLVDISDKEDITNDISEPLGYSSSLDKIGLAQKHNIYLTNSMSKYRGKLLSKESYSASKKIVQVLKNEYNISDAIKSYNISLTSCPFGYASYKIYLKPCLLLQEQIVENGIVTSTIKYQYDSQNQINKQELKNSDGNNLLIEYRYPYNYTDNVSKLMVDYNFISPIIEKIKFVDSREVSRMKSLYSYRKNTESQQMSFFPTKVQTSYSGESKFITEETYDIYDNFNNILQKTSKDGLTTSYLWSYNGQYVIAEIKNGTYDQVKDVLGIDPKTISSTLNPNINQIESLREKLPKAQTSIYSYKPLVGMLTSTDPTGLTTYYEYDNFGRLTNTYIDNLSQTKDLLKRTEYNYWTTGAQFPLDPEIPEGLLPDAYEKGLASSVYISIPTDGNGVDMQGWDYDNNKIQDGQPIVKTYKTIEIDEYTWLSENLRLKYKWNDWMNLTQANVDDYSNFYLGGKKITLQQFENIFGTWVSLYPKALSYMDRFAVFSAKGGSSETGWQLPSSEDIWQLYGLAPRKSENIYQDIQDFLFMSPCENDLDLRKNMMNRENTSGLTLTPLGMRESFDGDEAKIYGFGTTVGLRTNGWYRMEVISDIVLKPYTPGIRSLDLAHFSQARYIKPKTDQELGYKMYVDSAKDKVLMLPYDQVSTLPELVKGLERGIALRYANREYKVVLKKWSEIQAEATEIRNALASVSVPQPLPACDRPVVEVLPDPYEKGKEGKTTMWFSAAPPNYGVYAYDYDNKVGLDEYSGSWKTYPTIEIGEYEVTSKNLMIHYRDKWGLRMNWMNFSQDIINQMNQDFQGENNVSLTEFQDINGGYVSLYNEAPSYRNGFRFYESTDRTKLVTGWDLMSSTDFFQMIGQAPRESDNVYQNTMDFLGAGQADVPESYKANWFRNKNTSGFTMTPLGRRHSGEAGENGQKWFGYKIESAFRLKDYPIGLIAFNESQGITINTYLYHLCQARYCRPKTDQELGYKMYIDAANDQVVMLPYTESSTLPELPRGMERGVALRYTNREHMKVTKPWSEIQAEASAIKSTIKYVTN